MIREFFFSGYCFVLVSDALFVQIHLMKFDQRWINCSVESWDKKKTMKQKNSDSLEGFEPGPRRKFSVSGGGDLKQSQRIHYAH